MPRFFKRSYKQEFRTKEAAKNSGYPKSGFWMLKKGRFRYRPFKTGLLDILEHFINKICILYKMVQASHHFELSGFKMVGNVAKGIAMVLTIQNLNS